MGRGRRHVAIHDMNLKDVVGIVVMVTMDPKAGIAGAENGIGPGTLVEGEGAV
jgi:hypothetical protein